MAKSEQQRQKKLAKKRSKDLRNRRELAQRNQAMNSIAGQMQWASRYSVHSCYVSDRILGDQGLGVIYLNRKLSDGRIAMMFLLIDALCLGVKDAGAKFCTESELEEIVDRSSSGAGLVSVDPSYARKLTEDAIAFAHSLGFVPHPDYRKVAPLWGDIDPSVCDQTFQFGVNGRPHFVGGPYDDDARQNFIFRRLCETVGEGNFDFSIGGPGIDLSDVNFAWDDDPALDFSDDDDEYDDDDPTAMGYLDDHDADDNVIDGSVSRSSTSRES